MTLLSFKIVGFRSELEDLRRDGFRDVERCNQILDRVESAPLLIDIARTMASTGQTKLAKKAFLRCRDLIIDLQGRDQTDALKQFTKAIERAGGFEKMGIDKGDEAALLRLLLR